MTKIAVFPSSVGILDIFGEVSHNSSVCTYIQWAFYMKTLTMHLPPMSYGASLLKTRRSKILWPQEWYWCPAYIICDQWKLMKAKEKRIWTALYLNRILSVLLNDLIIKKLGLLRTTIEFLYYANFLVFVKSWWATKEIFTHKKTKWFSTGYEILNTSWDLTIFLRVSHSMISHRSFSYFWLLW